MKYDENFGHDRYEGEFEHQEHQGRQAVGSVPEQMWPKLTEGAVRRPSRRSVSPCPAQQSCATSSAAACQSSPEGTMPEHDDPLGVLLGAWGDLEAPDRLRIVDSRGDTVLGIWSDEFDVHYVQLHRITTPADDDS